jgi:hypothetical protein
MRMESYNSLHKEGQKLWKLRKPTETGGDVAHRWLSTIWLEEVDNSWWW